MPGLLARILPLCLASALAGQVQLADIFPGRTADGGFTPSSGVTMQGNFYFAGTRWDTGRELWRSDGTAAGTYLVADLTGGVLGSVPSYLVGSTSHIWFTAAGSVWTSDGSLAGTRAIAAGIGNNPFSAVVLGNRVLWPVRVGSTYQLLSHDGSTATPVLLGTYGQCRELVASGGRAYFVAEAAATGFELWHTDGTPAGTVLLDAAPGVAGTDPAKLVADGAGGVWYLGTDHRGRELWRSDGTLAGTGMVADLTPGIASTDLEVLHPFGNRVLLSGNIGQGYGRELWISDGTVAGTTLLGDLRPGNGGSDANSFYWSSALQRVLFCAQDLVNGREVWITDGTSAGTFLLGDLDPGIASSTSGLDLHFQDYGGFVYFTARSAASGRELYRTDGTIAGTMRVTDLFPGTESSSARPLAEVGGKLLISAYLPSLGSELMHMTTTQVPTLIPGAVAGTPNGSMPATSAPVVPLVASLDGAVHFIGYNSVYGSEPYTTRGTPATTSFLADFGTGGTQLLGSTTTHVFYSVRTAPSNTLGRLVSIDRSGVERTLHPRQVKRWAVLDDLLIFAPEDSGSEPHVSDGTWGGTFLLRDVRPGVAGSGADSFVRFGDEVWFQADDGVTGFEPWRTDGTPNGTVPALDLAPGAGSPGSLRFHAGNSRLFMVGESTWRSTDGTPAGTTPPQPLNWGTEPCVLGDLLIGSDGSQVWRSDGSAIGTFPLLSLPMPGSNGATSFVVARDRAFFVIRHPTSYQELWSTDGSVAGTVPVVPMGAVANSTVRTLQTVGLGHVAVPRATFEHGNELWISDGTPTGTILVGDVESGPAPSNPTFVRGDSTAGGHFVWWASTHSTGQEPWAVPLSRFGGADRDLFGLGCPGSRGVPQIDGYGLPIVGSSQTGFQLRRALPNSFAYLAIGFAKASSGPCALLTSAEITVPLMTDSAGRATHGFAVPFDPAFVSLELTAQFVCLDPQGAFGLVSGTPGMHVLVGR